MGPIIDLTALFPWRILMLFGYSFAYYNIAHAILKDKIHPLVTFSSIFAVRTLLSVIFFNSENLNPLGFPIFLVLSFVLILFLTEGKVVTKIIVSVFYFISYFATGAFLSILMGIVYQGKGYEEVFGYENPNLDHLYMYVVKLICFVAVSFLFSGGLKLFAARKAKQEHKKLYAFFSFFPLSHIFTVIIALFSATGSGNDNTDFGATVNILVYLLMGVILIFDCSFPFVADHLEKVEEKYQENKKELELSKLKYEQTQILKNEIQGFRKIKHDFLNLCATAKQFIENGNTEKAIELLDNTSSDLNNNSRHHYCTNDTINTVLYIKEIKAQKENINLTINVKQNANLNIDDYDLCRVMNNLIDNAIEAAQSTEQKGVDIKISVSDKLFTLNCANNFLKDKKSTKNSTEHGFGIPIVKDIVKKYNGEYESSTNDNMYCVKINMTNTK